MSQITCHVLDTSRGCPAADLKIGLFQQTPDGQWLLLGQRRTNSDGRISDLLDEGDVLAAGCYRVCFETRDYLRTHDLPVFYPYVDVVFEINADGQHYHIPLLLSPYGYSTYRGS